MPEIKSINILKNKTFAAILYDFVLIILAVVFIALYAAAFSGKFDPLRDNTTLYKLEPVIFILIGYLFGIYPSRQNEKNLKEEIARQTQRADAAQHAKEKAQQEREVLEEKIKNARSVLKTVESGEQLNNEIFKTFKGIMNN